MKPAQIILIEDNPADVHLVELALKESGISYSLTRFESGIEAVRALLRAGWGYRFTAGCDSPGPEYAADGRF
jgi:CheY-like chemotaxis protein